MRVLIGCQLSNRDDFDVRQLIRLIKTKRDGRDIRCPVGARAAAHRTTSAEAMRYLYLTRAKPIPVNVGVKPNDEQGSRGNQDFFLPRHRKPAEQQVVAKAEQPYSVASAFPVKKFWGGELDCDLR